mmetsp:Transcript_70743/g.182405  ORF Transcript_70743/g.182405 Transcript_70743/m.182405 type:complete len:292 (+) Transcript_70743:300-1175(+)
MAVVSPPARRGGGRRAPRRAKFRARSERRREEKRVEDGGATPPSLGLARLCRARPRGNDDHSQSPVGRGAGLLHRQGDLAALAETHAPDRARETLLRIDEGVDDGGLDRGHGPGKQALRLRNALEAQDRVDGLVRVLYAPHAAIADQGALAPRAERRDVLGLAAHEPLLEHRTALRLGLHEASRHRRRHADGLQGRDLLARDASLQRRGVHQALVLLLPRVPLVDLPLGALGGDAGVLSHGGTIQRRGEGRERGEGPETHRAGRDDGQRSRAPQRRPPPDGHEVPGEGHLR